MRNQKGITLVALIITIIILLILAIVSINLVMNGGIIGKAEKGTDSYLEAEIKEKVNLAYNEWKMDKELGGSLDLKEVVENELNESYGAESVNVSKAGKGILIKVTQSGKEYEYTLIDDGTTVNGQLAYLDIADGNIDLYENGYTQSTGNLKGINKKNITTAYTGKYIITGTTTENVVRVCDVGTYDITIKDLNIDAKNNKGTNNENLCTAFNANRGAKADGCFVNLKLLGNNVLKGRSAPGLGFTRANPNINGKTNGSTLIISGTGNLEALSTGYSAAIGSGYSGWEASAGTVSNIIINSGNIIAYNVQNSHGAGIGGGLYQKVNNIVINGGNIYTKAGFYCPAIGSTSTVDNIIINGGSIEAYTGGYTTAIGSRSDTLSGTIKIIGGNIIATGTNSKSYNYEAIGHGMQNIIIEGGTIKTDSKESSGIFKSDESNVRITGGNLQLGGIGDIGTLDSDKNFVQGISTDGTNNLYKTQIKLQGVEKDKQVTRLTTSDNINYGIKDMYTLEDGMLYLYLPLGTRTIDIELEGNTYSGTVETKETSEVVTLNKVN